MAIAAGFSLATWHRHITLPTYRGDAITDPGSSGGFPLAAGHFIGRMPMLLVHPRPDAETETYARHRNAHSQFSYEIPIKIQGGAWPFKYEILSGPAGATIGQFYTGPNDPDYGTIKWSPPASGSFTFTARVTDQNLATLDLSWSVTVDDNAFVIIQDGYAGTKLGTWTQPLATWADWYKGDESDATYANKIITFRGGNYSVLGDPNGSQNNTEHGSGNVYLTLGVKSLMLIGVPTEYPILDCSTAKIIGGIGVQGDLFCADLHLQNARSDVANSHFWLSWTRISRATWWRNKFDNLTSGTAGNDNTCPVFITNSSVERHSVVFSNNELLNINNPSSNGSYFDCYNTFEYVVEGNNCHDCNTTWGFWIKASKDFGSIRNNECWDNVTGRQCTLGYGPEAPGDPHDNEVCYNRFRIPSGSQEIFQCTNSSAWQHYNTYIYRNTFVNGQVLIRFIGAEPFETDSNIVINDNLGSWDTSIMTTVEPNILGAENSGIVDQTGALIGASRIAYLGLKGHEVADAQIAPAVEVFSLDINGSNIVQNQSSGNAQAGGGYIQFLANPQNGAGSGINDTNIDVIDITDDPLFGAVKGLRDTYQQGGNAYSFGNQTAFIQHQEMSKFYMRMRVKWSTNWETGSDQNKFCKNKGSGGSFVSTNCPKFSGSGYAYITKLSEFGNQSQNELNVRAVRTEPDNTNNAEDGFNNEFGGAGIDQNWVPARNQWYWLEWEIDADSAGSSNGSYKIWIDEQLYMQLDNVQVSQTGDQLFTSHELGHVWQNGTPTQDIWMDWHNIEIFDKKPAGALPVGTPSSGATYTALKKAAFSSGVSGAQIITPDLSIDLTKGEFSNDIAGPFGDAITGKFKGRSTSNFFGGQMSGALGIQTLTGSSMWIRNYYYFPTAFCAGYQTGGDGYGSTKWFRLGYADNGLRITLQLSGFQGGVCSSNNLNFNHVSLEIDSGEVVVSLPTAAIMTRDVWHAFQMQIGFDSGNAGFIRFWLGTTYLGEASGFHTLPNSDNILDNITVGDYWNGRPFQSTDWYNDEIIMTTETPNTLDGGGRPYISPATRVSDV